MRKLLLVIVFFRIAFSINAQNVTPEVTTKSGILRGVTAGDVTVFKGIPYAAPPVGEYRWRPPQPVKAWEGVRDASKFGANCAQGGWGTAPGKIQEGSSEDCLYLNLWIPAGSKADAKLPVMVWIHGGAFVGGSGAQPDFSGEQFAKQGVILLTFNYRLGRLGHFAFPALSKEHPEEPKGSYAYMDQIAALKWIKENIAAFGGNPNNVTIFGESAGGVSVHSLLTIPSAKGLFDKAIIESGGGREGILSGRPINKESADSFYIVSAETIGVNFARKHGIEGTDENALAKLRALSVEEIVDGGQETDGQGGARIYSGPVIDGKLVVESFESAYKTGHLAKVPLIIGSNSAEIGGNFVNNSKSKEELFALFGQFGDEFKTAYDPLGNKEFAEVQALFNTDWVWAEPARMTANVFVSANLPTYIYHFGYVPESMKQRMPYGAPHGSEISYVFNTLNARWGNPQTTADEQQVATVMNTYWANFAKTGNPNGKNVPLWPSYSIKKYEILDVERNGKFEGKPDFRKARLDIIEKAFKFRYRLQSRGI